MSAPPRPIIPTATIMQAEELVSTVIISAEQVDNQQNADHGKDANSLGKFSLEQLKEYYCSCGSVRFKWMQVFANKKTFTALMCMFTIVQGSIVSGINSVNISSLEKRYSFSSTLAGLFAATYDLTIVIGVIFISYAGGRTHKPRFLGISAIVLSIGNFVMASPQFLFGSYKNTSSSSSAQYEECMSTSTVDDDCSPANIGAYIILIIGQIFIGIGSSALYTVGTAYIDEIVQPRFVSLHIGTFLTFSAFGPAIGYLLGSFLLSIYVDPWIETDLTTSDPNWVGAWWIGLVLMGCLAIVVAIMFLMFPKWLPDSHLVRKERAKEMAKIYPSTLVNEDPLTLAFKEFPIHIKRLLTNASFMLAVFGTSMLYVILDILVTFGPKYIETMFNVTATVSGLIAGGTAILAAASGVLTGSLIIHFWKPKGCKTAIIQFVTVTLSIPFLLTFVYKCPSDNVAGIVVPYSDGSFDGKDSSVCAMNCSCVSSVYEPVCGSDGITYFSPCRAGCDDVDSSENGEYAFRNCSCIAESLMMSNLSTFHNNTAVEGICPTDCNLLIPFVATTFVLVFLLFSLNIPSYYFTLRVVADDQRHLALGLQSAVVRTFGSIPGGLLFGVIIDQACVEWEYNCGIRGNCWIYDNDRLSLYGVATCLPFGFLSALLLFLSFVVYPKKIDTQTIVEATNELATKDEAETGI